MKKIVLSLFTILVSGQIVFAQKATFKINVKNCGEVTVQITQRELMRQKIEPQTIKDREFLFELDIKEPRYFTLSIGNKLHTEILVSPNTKSEIRYEADSIVCFSGANADVNNYIYKLYNASPPPKFDNEYDMSKQRVAFHLAEYEKILSKINRAELKDHDKKILIGYFQCDLLFRVFSTAEVSKAIGKVKMMHFEDGYADKLSGFEFVPEITYNTKWGNIYAELINYKMGCGAIKIKNPDYWIIESANSIINRELREKYIVSAISKEVRFGYVHNIDKRIEVAKKHVTSKKIIDGLEEQRQLAIKMMPKYKNCQPGTYVGDITFLDTKGNVVPLSNFKGKYVFIDMWSTGCSPCVSQIPYLEKMEHKFLNDPVVFVSISSDTNTDTWLNFIKKRNLSGEQLIIAREKKNEFLSLIGADGIPQFVILDKESRIVNYNTYRPSDEILSIKLKQLTNKK